MNVFKQREKEEVMETEVLRIYPTNKGKLLAYAVVRLGGFFVLNGITIYQGKKCLYINLPNIKGKNGFIEALEFVSSMEREKFNEKVRQAYLETLSEEKRREILQSINGMDHEDIKTEEKSKSETKIRWVT